jgi:hypothetical protein
VEVRVLSWAPSSLTRTSLDVYKARNSLIDFRFICRPWYETISRQLVVSGQLPKMMSYPHAHKAEVRSENAKSKPYKLTDSEGLHLFIN